MILAQAGRLRGAEISFRVPSVGATENALTAAVLADGTTVLKNCAREPEISELCRFLAAMGADISGAGTSTLIIRGVPSLSPCEFDLGADRIAAGTYLAAGVCGLGDVAVEGVLAAELSAPLSVFRKMGAEISVSEGGMEIRLKMKKRPSGFSLRTGPYPGFPTDLQSPFLAAACMAVGESRIEETVFEARFEAARQMRLFGARLALESQTAKVTGQYPLMPAVARAPDLRGGAALLLLALAADGLSIVTDMGHVKRGYEDICRDLALLGADVLELNL